MFRLNTITIYVHVGAVWAVYVHVCITVSPCYLQYSFLPNLNPKSFKGKILGDPLSQWQSQHWFYTISTWGRWFTPTTGRVISGLLHHEVSFNLIQWDPCLNLAGGFILFLCSPPKIGEDEPILTFPYVSKWVGENHHLKRFLGPRPYPPVNCKINAVGPRACQANSWPVHFASFCYISTVRKGCY